MNNSLTKTVAEWADLLTAIINDVGDDDMSDADFEIYDAVDSAINGQEYDAEVEIFLTPEQVKRIQSYE